METLSASLDAQYTKRMFTCRYKKKEDSRQVYLSRDMYLSSSHTLKNLIDQSSGSGSGLPLLVSGKLELGVNR